MADSYHIRMTPRALRDRDEIFAYIQRDSPQNAAKMIETILDAIDGLNILPYRYILPRTGAQSDEQIRSMPVWPYLVRYRIEETKETVYIVRIRHGARRRS